METETVCWTGLAEMEPLVRVYARRRCKDSHELDDIVQETLLRAARYRPRLLDGQKLKGWTLRIAAFSQPRPRATSSGKSEQ